MGFIQTRSAILHLCLLLVLLAYTTICIASPSSVVFESPKDRFSDRSIQQLLTSIHQKHHSKTTVIQSSLRRFYQSRRNPKLDKLVNSIQHPHYRSQHDSHLHSIGRQINGFTGNECSTDSDCAGPRFCARSVRGVLNPCSGLSGCFCHPEDPSDFSCSCDDLRCLNGDVCVDLGRDSGCVATDLNFRLQVCETPLPSPTAGSFGMGLLTIDSCSEDANCAGPRQCARIDNREILPCATSSDCFCIPIDENLLRCSCGNLECLDGDVCVGVGDEDGSLCIASDNDNFTPLDCTSPIGPPMPLPLVVPFPIGQGGLFTGEVCRDGSDCAGARVCIGIENDVPLPCRNQSFCICEPIFFEDTACSCEDPGCLDGDVCSDLGGDFDACISADLDLIPVLVCETTTPFPEPSDEAIV